MSAKHPVFYYKDLIRKWGDRLISEEEKGILFTWINEHASDEELMDILQEEYAHAEADSRTGLMPVDMQERILSKVLGTPTRLRQREFRIFRNRKIGWAAAIVALSLGLVAYLAFFRLDNAPATGYTLQSKTVDIAAPVTNRAIIALSNGITIGLDTMRSGQPLAIPGGELVKTGEGYIEYNRKGDAGAEDTLMHQLFNPKGSKVIQLKLTDGSLVWLNAGSVISYPAAFSKEQRKVSMSGEAYFEVAHNKKKPFVVSKRGVVNIEVLGTRFNVTAYDQQAEVTLLEGAVKISADGPASLHNRFRMLKPGQQAVVNSDTIALAHADVPHQMAWKEGFFSFKNYDLAAVLGQLAVWYDLEIVYDKGSDSRQFSGELSRNLSLKQVLAVLEESNVKFKIDGKKLIVAP